MVWLTHVFVYQRQVVDAPIVCCCLERVVTVCVCACVSERQARSVRGEEGCHSFPFHSHSNTPLQPQPQLPRTMVLFILE